jgi:integrative and conjugative element protein (TIGR02256 family)
LEWMTEDRRFTVYFKDSLLNKILNHCERASGLETGGILVGYYSNSLVAHITQLSGPPLGSAASPFSFSRGIVGLQPWLNKLWYSRPKIYYLGEWHYHPGSSPQPSNQDATEMALISLAPRYRCPEPLLFIVGGVVPTALEKSLHLHLPSSGLVPLQQI